MQLHPATLAFLDTINERNSREFFATVKELYLEIWKDINAICQGLIDEAITLDSNHTGLKPKDCLFRIYRDARRIGEGDPLYKRNFGMSIAPEGKKSQAPSYYFHIEKSGSFFGGGLYWPHGDQLLNLRHYLEIHGDEYTNILNNKDLKKYFGSLQGASLSKPPRGFSNDTPHLPLIKMKQHLLLCPISDKELLESDILALCKKYMHTMSPWIAFLNAGCDYTEWEDK